MKRSVPTVTLGLPVFNGARYLPATIESLLNQTFDDFALYIVDNASTDATSSIGRQYAEQDARVRYIQNERNVGAAANFNRAFNVAPGPYFKWVAHDDLYAPTFLSACVDALESHPLAVLAYAPTRWIDEHGALLPFDAERQAYVDANGTTYYERRGHEHELEAPDPLTRFRSILLQRHSTFCHEVYGLIRTAALGHTGLIDSFYGSDRVLLAELSLHGSFLRVSNTCFLRRCHPQQSRAARTTQAQARWITGQKAGRFVLPQWRMFRGYLQALYASDLRGSQRLRGALSVLRLAVRPDKLKRLVLPGPANYFGWGRTKPPDANSRAPRQYAPTPASPPSIEAPSATRSTDRDAPLGACPPLP